MIYVCVVREAVCEVCSGQFTLAPGEAIPDKCIHCGSVDWLYGREPMEGIYIRNGISRERRALNPGARARNRQVRGQAQYRQFKPKAVDEPEEPTDN